MKIKLDEFGKINFHGRMKRAGVLGGEEGRKLKANCNKKTTHLKTLT